MATPTSTSLGAINQIYGKEIICESYEDGSLKSEVLLYPCEDITIENSISVEFFVPADFTSRGKLQLKTKDVTAFKNCSYLISADGVFQFPWMETAKYPLAVWFFSVRNLLSKPGHPPWSTPVTLKPSFPLRYSISSSKENLANAVVSSSGVSETVVTHLVAGAGRTRGRRPYMEVNCQVCRIISCLQSYCLPYHMQH